MARASAQSRVTAEVPLPPGVRVHRAFLPVRAAAALQHRCETAVRFAAHPVRLFGRTMQTPRETAFLAPVGVRYRYSGHEHEGEGVPDWLRAMVAAVADRSRADFVSVLATRYRSGRDHVGWHADDERELGVDPVIAVLSLGAERDLCFRPASPVATERWRVPLAAGDLLVMGPGVQRRFRHALPARSGVGPRISLSFRPAMDVGP